MGTVDRILAATRTLLKATNHPAPVSENPRHAGPHGTMTRDWSTEIARALMVRSRISVDLEAELDLLLHQAKANKTLARILPMIDVISDSNKAKIESAKTETQYRLRDALKLLMATQHVFLDNRVPFAVIKSLDALPDMGHDIDLLVGKNLGRARKEILERFYCRPVTLTFCDRQAGKFSTFVEGFESDFELYTRFSQLGEEYYSEEGVLARRMWSSSVDGGTYTCSVEDRLLISCIHAMYRHGKIRLSDLNVVYEAYRSRIDLDFVLRTVEASGAQRGFAVFMKTLERLGLEVIGHDALPIQVKEYVDRVIASDRILRILVNSLRLKFPIRIPVRMLILLFLHKAAADFARSKVRSCLRSTLAPMLLLLDKAIPLRLQKAISVRMW